MIPFGYIPKGRHAGPKSSPLRRLSVWPCKGHTSSWDLALPICQQQQQKRKCNWITTNWERRKKYSLSFHSGTAAVSVTGYTSLSTVDSDSQHVWSAAMYQTLANALHVWTYQILVTTLRAGTITTPLSRWRNRGTKRLSDLPKGYVHTGQDGTAIWTQSRCWNPHKDACLHLSSLSYRDIFLMVAL